MSAAGGGATNAVVGAGAASVAAGAVAAGVNFISVALTSVAAAAMSVPDIGGASATRAFAVEGASAEDIFVEDAFAFEVEAAESAEAGVDAGEGRLCRSAAKADDPSNVKNIAATATLISLPRRERKRARTIEYRLNVDFYWQFLPRKPLVKIGPATELRELRALPESEQKGHRNELSGNSFRRQWRSGRQG